MRWKETGRENSTTGWRTAGRTWRKAVNAQYGHRHVTLQETLKIRQKSGLDSSGSKRAPVKRCRKHDHETSVLRRQGQLSRVEGLKTTHTPTLNYLGVGVKAATQMRVRPYIPTCFTGFEPHASRIRLKNYCDFTLIYVNSSSSFTSSDHTAGMSACAVNNQSDWICLQAVAT